MQQAGGHGHVVEVWHTSDEGATRYVTCTRCRLGAWRIAGRITFVEIGLRHPCRGQENPEHVRLRTRLGTE